MSEFVGYRDGGKTSEEGFSRWIAQVLTSGVPTVGTSTSFAVTQRGAGANMSVDIAVGDAMIPYSSYVFHGFSNAVFNRTITAADPSNPRRSIIVAYVDLAVVSSASNNNIGALKFLSVNGTAAASPADPLDATIQSAVGAGNPWVKLARVQVAAAASSVVNANITDLRTPIAFKGRLWGGSSNTSGHIVPNVADSMLIVSTTGLVETANIATGAVTDLKIGTAAILLGFSSITADQTTSSVTAVQVTGLTKTVTVPSGGRSVKITVVANSIRNATAASNSEVSLWTGTVGSGTQLAAWQATSFGAGEQTPIGAPFIHTPASGSITYNVGFRNIGGSTVTFAAGATTPAQLIVELI
jgi:hypothetical protein